MQWAPNALKYKGKVFIFLYSIKGCFSTRNRSEGFTLVGSPNHPLPHPLPPTYYLWNWVLTDLKGMEDNLWSTQCGVSTDWGCLNAQGVVSEGLYPEAGEPCRNPKSSGKQAGDPVTPVPVPFSVSSPKENWMQEQEQASGSKALIMGFPCLLPNGLSISCFLCPATLSCCIL